jgi:glucose/arabinose dehydrogenase
MTKQKWMRCGCGVLFLFVVLAGCDLLPQRPLPPGTQVSLQQIADDLAAPVKLVPVPDGSGRLFVVDQVGLIRVIDSFGNLRAEPFLDLRSRMTSLSAAYDERGLLGLAFHPRYASNGRFFVYYTAPPSDQTPAGFNNECRVSRFFVAAGDVNRGDADTEKIILRIQQPQANHNGGDLAFGPDAMLYISTGDGGGANDTSGGHTPGLGNAQDKTRLLGKILRIDIDGGDPYAVPEDNPFVNDPGALGEIWAFGFRNPFRFSFDRGGSRRLFAGDVGQNLYEEVDIVTRGGNYGWNIREGAHCFNPNNPNSAPANCTNVGADGSALIGPIVEYPHSGSGPRGISVIGGYIYRGSDLPDLAGRYVFGDFSRGFGPDGSLLVATNTGGPSWSLEELVIANGANGRIGRYVLGFGEDDHGELYVLTQDVLGPTGTSGKVFKIAPAP